MDRSLAELLLRSPSGQRIVPIEAVHAYRDAGPNAPSVTFSRAVSCMACSGRGCRWCELVGWRVETVRTEVPIPHGAARGTRVTLEGIGDSLDDRPTSVVVEVCDSSERIAELRAAQADLEAKLESAWVMDRDARRRRRYRRRVAVAAAAAGLVLLPIVHWALKSGVGARCSSDAECRSGDCIVRMISDVSSVGICSGSCATDLDCPAPMVCRVDRDADKACVLR